MLYHIRSKYTAVGRKEITLFFYIYMFIELLAIFLDSSIIPTGHAVYPVSLRVSPVNNWFNLRRANRKVVCSDIRRRDHSAILVHHD